ncbi:hypothetical protein [Seonamhaeicola marinus]|uniref:Uncharacterized protein n=1 Tax=Seonamhaeicola marinus TaxID=1912246 RepID=A0A5D0HSU4_9FLAO|nr:hypothetical protein [Seonamhaeicola marinus]TYA74394.1 hypothetical protein FUA24_13800 [Seonamhaeicola marinus]
MSYTFSGYLDLSGANYGFKTPVLEKNGRSYIQILNKIGLIAFLEEIEPDETFEKFEGDSPSFFVKRNNQPISCLTYNDICYVGLIASILLELGRDFEVETLPLILQLEYFLYFDMMLDYNNAVDRIESFYIRKYFKNKGKNYKRTLRNTPKIKSKSGASNYNIIHVGNRRL